MSSEVSQYGTLDGKNRALLDGWDNACCEPARKNEELKICERHTGRVILPPGRLWLGGELSHNL